MILRNIYYDFESYMSPSLPCFTIPPPWRTNFGPIPPPEQTPVSLSPPEKKPDYPPLKGKIWPLNESTPPWIGPWKIPLGEKILAQKKKFSARCARRKIFLILDPFWTIIGSFWTPFKKLHFSVGHRCPYPPPWKNFRWPLFTPPLSDNHGDMYAKRPFERCI